MISRIPALVLLLGLIGSLGVPAQQPAAKTKGELVKLFFDELVLITPGDGKFPGKFAFGNPAKDAPERELPVVEVTLRHAFAIGKYEITQELYEALMGKNPAKWKGPQNSVEMCDAGEAREFCKLLTTELHKANLIPKNEVIRLPSEAEWEYCCKAGTTSRWSFGDKLADLGDHCWYKTNAPGNDPPVGMKKPNPWGLYDMHGYVAEWVEDSWAPDHKNAPKDGSPLRIADTKQVVARGGSFADETEAVTSTARLGHLQTTRSDQIGFRCVRARAGANP